MKVPELKGVVDVLTERVNALTVEVGKLTAIQAKTAEILNDHHLEQVGETVLIQRDIEDIKKWKSEFQKQKEERSRRAWAFGPNLTAAAIAVILAPISVYAWNYLFAYFSAPRP